MSETFISFARIFGLYAIVIAVAPLALFCGVEGWRALVWLFTSAASSGADGQVSSTNLIWALPYGLTVAAFVAMNAVGRWPFAVAGFSLGALKAAGITAGVYGLTDWLRALPPSPADYNLLAVTVLVTTVLLILCSAFIGIRGLRAHGI